MPDNFGWDDGQHAYATTVFGGPQGRSMTLVAVPAALLLGDAQLTVGSVANSLDAELLATAPDPAGSFLPHAVGAILAAADPAPARDLFNVSVGGPGGLVEWLGPEVYSFAMHVVYSPILGIEESPMRGKALGAIISFGSGLGLAVVAGLNAPILIAAAAGVGVAGGTIIVVSTAAAVAQRIYDRIAPEG